MWFKLFFWLRLFTNTAFFINLLSQTFEDVKNFMVLLLLLITAFANIQYIMNEKRMYENPDNPDTWLYSKMSSSKFVSAWLNSYLLGLGEFSIDNY